MRPVTKKNVGETIVVQDGTEQTILNDYRKHRESFPALVANLGQYCSYCECYSPCDSNLQVEHVQPVNLEINGIKPYKDLYSKWDNYLLACATCNGKGNKGCKDVILDDIHLPHRNNTFLSLEYKEGGVVIANPELTGKSLDNANALIELLGLDKGYTYTDGRIEMRRRVWEKAEEYLDDYKKGTIKPERLIDYVKATGCWSIWFTVFKGCDEVLEALIDGFPGTAKECFDPNNHYMPIPRNPDNDIDPI